MRLNFVINCEFFKISLKTQMLLSLFSIVVHILTQHLPYRKRYVKKNGQSDPWRRPIRQILIEFECLLVESQQKYFIEVIRCKKIEADNEIKQR